MDSEQLHNVAKFRGKKRKKKALRSTPKLARKKALIAEKTNLGTNVKIGIHRHYNNTIATLPNSQFVPINQISTIEMQRTKLVLP